MRAPARGILLLLAALAGLVIVMALSWPDEVDATPAQQTANDDSSDRKATNGASMTADASDRTSAPNLDRASIAAPSPSASTPLQPDPPGTFPVRVRVVDAATDAPVPDAEVAVHRDTLDWSGLTDDERHRFLRFGMDRHALLKSIGATERTDQHGLLVVHCRTTLTVTCEHDQRFGELFLERVDLRPEAEFRLLLHEDRRLTVHVSDAEGRPLPDLPLLLLPAGAAREHEVARLIFPGVQPWAFTDAGGNAVLRRLQGFVDMCTKLKLPAQRAALQLGIAGHRDIAFEFDLLDPPGGIVDVKAPSTGAVRVRLVDDRDAPTGRSEDLRLHLPDLGEEPPAGSGPWRGAPDGKGTARFHHVLLGRWFDADADGATVPTKRFLGPTRSGQLVDVVVRPGGNTPMLVGRLVDAAQQPLQRVTLRIPFHGEGYGPHVFLQAETDDDGRFRHEFAASMVGATITLEFVQPQSRSADRELIAVLDRTLRIPESVIDLGTIALRPSPLLVSGTVVVDSEPPAPRPELDVERLLDGAWSALRSATVRWGEDGMFAISGLAATEHRLVVTAPDCLPVPPLAFAAGQRDMRIELHRGGSLRAALQLDDPALARHLSFDLVPEAPTPQRLAALLEHGRPAGGHREEHGELPGVVWRGLEAGSYRLRCWVAGSVGPVVDVAGLEVPVGAACSDPRLSPVDLRGRLLPVQVSVRDPQGEPVNAVVWSNTGGGPVGDWVGRGGDTIVLAGPADLHVAAHGYAIETLTGVRSSQTVTLRALPTVPLLVPALETPAGTSLLLLASPTGLPIDDLAPRFGPGTYTLRDHTRPRLRRVSLGAAQRIELPVRPGEQLGLQVLLQRGNDETEVLGCTPARIGLEGGVTARLVVPHAAIVQALARLDARGR